MFSWRNRILMRVGMFFVPMTGGTLGYHWIEGWTLFDGFYMTVITLSTIGYGELHPLSTQGRLFTVFLILGGVFSFLYLMTDLIRAIVSGEVADILGRRHMEWSLDKMKDHVIVCGYGRMGRLVCKEFSRDKVPFVIIDRSEDAFHDFQVPLGIPIVGDATSDELLRRAGIDRARGLVTVMASDAANLFTTLSARLLAPTLFIVARVEDSETEEKMVRAGANRVVSPYQIGGSRVAQAVLRPTVVDFIDLATRTEFIELQMEEAQVSAVSPLAGSNLRDSRLRVDLKIIIVAIKKKEGHMVFNPPPETVLQPEDILVAIGHKDHLVKMSTLCAPPAGG